MATRVVLMKSLKNTAEFKIKNYRKVIAIGDIHGCINTLKELIDKINPIFDEDLIVFLGDYIDRGNFPLNTLRYVKSLQEKYPNNVICLKGNHEDMMCKYYLNDNKTWDYNNNELTKKEFGNISKEEMCSLIVWCSNLYNGCSVGRKFRFCHGGNWCSSKDFCGFDNILWDRNWFVYEQWKQDKDYTSSTKPNNTVIFGHTPMDNIYKIKNIYGKVIGIDIDTGAVYGGKLSAIIIDGKRNYKQRVVQVGVLDEDIR